MRNDTVRLYFEGGDDPYSHFALKFGTSAGTYQYGLTNIGDKNTRWFDVRYLQSRKAYYFAIQGVHGCAPGAWSAEVRVVVGSSESAQQNTSYSSNNPQTVSAKNASACVQDYVVKNGDSLWRIAQTVLGNGGRYKEIITRNVARYPRIQKGALDPGWKLSIASDCATKTNAKKTITTTTPAKTKKVKK